jgi:hypothetical protein
MTRRVFLSVLLSVSLSGLLLAVLFRQLRAGDLAGTFSRIYLPALGFYVAVSLLGAFLRAWRYKWLLRPRSIGWTDMMLVTFVRNAFDDLLPARVGSLSYIYVLNGRLGYPFEGAASSFVVAFVFDFLTLGPFVVAAALALGSKATALPSGLLPYMAVAFTTAVTLVVWKLVPILEFAGRVYARLLRVLRMDHRRAAAASLDKGRVTLAALRDIRDRHLYGRLLLISLLIRLAKYVSLFGLLFALLRSHGMVPDGSGFLRMILVLTGAEMTSALPVKGLADFGTWEAAWALAFRWMGFDPGQAVLSGIGLHLITNVFEYGLGLVSYLSLVRPRLKSRRRRPLV